MNLNISFQLNCRKFKNKWVYNLYIYDINMVGNRTSGEKFSFVYSINIHRYTLYILLIFLRITHATCNFYIIWISFTDTNINYKYMHKQRSAEPGI